MTLTKIVVSRLLIFMNEQNSTQYKLAQKIGVPFPTIKSIMQQKTKNISLRTIILLSRGLGIKASEFLDDASFDEVELL